MDLSILPTHCPLAPRLLCTPGFLLCCSIFFSEHRSETKPGQSSASPTSSGWRLPGSPAHGPPPPAPALGAAPSDSAGNSSGPFPTSRQQSEPGDLRRVHPWCPWFRFGEAGEAGGAVSAGHSPEGPGRVQHRPAAQERRTTYSAFPAGAGQRHLGRPAANTALPSPEGRYRTHRAPIPASLHGDSGRSSSCLSGAAAPVPPARTHLESPARRQLLQQPRHCPARPCPPRT